MTNENLIKELEKTKDKIDGIIVEVREERKGMTYQRYNDIMTLILNYGATSFKDGLKFCEGEPSREATKSLELVIEELQKEIVW